MDDYFNMENSETYTFRIRPSVVARVDKLLVNCKIRSCLVETLMMNWCAKVEKLNAERAAHGGADSTGAGTGRTAE